MVHKLGRAKLICLLLGIITLALYWPATKFAFTNCDDPDYVIENTAIHGGITKAAVSWAFERFYACNWHPLTWLSHALDCQIFGLNASGHHLTSILFHAANAMLLFLVLQRLAL